MIQVKKLRPHGPQWFAEEITQSMADVGPLIDPVWVDVRLTAGSAWSLMFACLAGQQSPPMFWAVHRLREALAGQVDPQAFDTAMRMIDDQLTVPPAIYAKAAEFSIEPDFTRGPKS